MRMPNLLARTGGHRAAPGRSPVAVRQLASERFRSHLLIVLRYLSLASKRYADRSKMSHPGRPSERFRTAVCEKRPEMPFEGRRM